MIDASSKAIPYTHSISGRLTLAFAGVVTAALVICVCVGIWMYQTQASISEKILVAERAVRGGETILLRMSEMSDAMRGVLLDPTSKVEMDRKKKADDALVEEIKTLTEEIGDAKSILNAINAISDFDEKTLNPIEDKLFEVVKSGADEARKYYANVYAPIRKQEALLVDRMIEEISKYRNHEEAEAARARSALFVSAGASILLSLIVGLLAGRYIGSAIARPILSLAQTMLRVASNDDLRTEIREVSRRDEVGQMALALKVFKENAIAKINADKAQAAAMAEQDRMKAQLAQNEADERARQIERSKKIEAMIHDFEAESHALLSGLGDASERMKDVASQLGRVVNDTLHISSAVSDAAQEASSNVATVASATEEMSASIGEISRQVSNSATATGAAVATSDNASAQILELAKAAERIGEIVRVIADVASKTDLLALNATIEAARAGEAGKGFAVVASEVKQLASQTAKATGDIDSQVRSIQEATRRAVDTVQDVAKTIGSVNSMVASIAAAIEEQSSATAEISRNTQDVSAATSVVTQRISEVTSLAAQSGNAAKNVDQASRDVNAQSGTMAERINSFISQVRSI